MKRRQQQSSSSSQNVALKRGTDELHSILEWALRDGPRTLARWRHEYRQYCLRIYRATERAAGARP